MRIWIEGTVGVQDGKATIDFEGNAGIIPGEPIQSIDDFVSDFLFAHGSEFDGRVLRITIEDKQT